jgi:hypothetical protein
VAQAETPSSGLGPVFAYGQRLQEPYVFSAGEGDTLLLNGYPYLPQRHSPLEISAEVLENDKLERALEARIASQWRLKSPTEPYVEWLARMYREAPEVARVRLQNGSLFVKYVWAPYEVVKETGVSTRMTRTHQGNSAKQEPCGAAKEHFWSQVKSGCMIVFGTDYYLVVARPHVRDALRQIDRAMTGTKLEELGPLALPLTIDNFLREAGVSRSERPDDK